MSYSEVQGKIRDKDLVTIFTGKGHLFELIWTTTERKGRKKPAWRKQRNVENYNGVDMYFYKTHHSLF